MTLTLRDAVASVLCVGPLCCLLVSCSPPVSYTVPMYTFGPDFTSPSSIAALNATLYAGSLPPLNLSWPVVRLAGAITLNGQYNTYGVEQQLSLQFMLDLINAKGGVLVDGVPHLMSLTWASDDSSFTLLDYLYSTWMDDPHYDAFVAPVNNAQLQALNPLILGSNRTFINIFAIAAANFASHYPFIWTAIELAEQEPVASLDFMNILAQQYHAALSSGQVQPSYAGETTSSWGIASMCLYTHNDPDLLLSANGVRDWINATNAARLAAGASMEELIAVEQDVLWDIDSNAVDQQLYYDTITLCPDHVDLLLVNGQTTQDDAAAVAAAMAEARLRPKAAFSTSSLPGYSPSNATLAYLYSGWFSFAEDLPLPATMPGATFADLDEVEGAWVVYFNGSTSELNGITLAYPAQVEMLKGALTLTRSLSPDDLRAAFLALNGTRSYIVPIDLDPVTGANDGAVTQPGQLSAAAGLVVASNETAVSYPYNWPWTRVQVGDSLSMAQASTNVIVGWVLAVLGCWVGQIIVEQAVFVRRRGGWYQLWLLLVAIALGGAGVWCGQWTMSSALSLTLPGDSSPMPLSFSLDIAVLAALPAIILSWCGLYVLMRDVEDNSADATNAKHGVAHATRQIIKEQKAEQRKRAALSHRAHFLHLCQSLSVNVVVGSTLVALAIGVSRVTLWYNWSAQTTVVSSAVGWLVSALAAVVLVLPSLLMYFHALKWRTMAVLMLSGAVMVDWQVHIYTIDFEYALAAAQQGELLLSSTAVQLITGIITAVTCFGFVGLQFSRMQLSRNGLSVLVASLENVIHRQKTSVQELRLRLMQKSEQADELVRMLEAINTMRPIQKEYAWALAKCANTTTFMQLYDAPVRPPVRGSVHSSVAGKADAVISVVRRTQEAATESDDPTRLSVQSPASPQRRLSSASVTAPDDGRIDDGGEQLLSRRAAPRLSEQMTTSPTAASVAPALPVTASAASAHHGPSHSRESLTVSAAATHADHQSRAKQFETELLAMLSTQSRLSAVDHPHSSGSEPHSAVSHADFSLDAAVKTRPTLLELLRHPVCVELLKDELQRLHSVESLVFYLHAVRYRRLQTAKARLVLASLLYDTFIAQSAPQEINISTRQREAIQQQLRKRGADAATPQLFVEAEKEVLWLMETNVMKAFTGTAAYRAAALLIAQLDMDRATGRWQPDHPSTNRQRDDGWNDKSTISHSHDSGAHGAAAMPSA